MILVGPFRLRVFFDSKTTLYRAETQKQKGLGTLVEKGPPKAEGYIEDVLLRFLTSTLYSCGNPAFKAHTRTSAVSQLSVSEK